MNTLDKINVAIIGLGYVGLPLLKLFSGRYSCTGIDSDSNLILRLQKEYLIQYRKSENFVHYTNKYSEITKSDIIIITVPTPVDQNNKPNLQFLESACINIGPYLKQGSMIIFESTVAPGTTEEVCIPLLEKHSNKKLNKDFFVGYSPERVNVGDLQHTTYKTPKIISASSDYALDIVERLYSSVIEAPLTKATSIKVAEAAKMYENVQRDVLIGLANEYSEFCRAIGINIHEVTQCASSKWNFSNVLPGLVGGHCIGVDTYYLLKKAEETGQSLFIIKTARDTNENKSNIVSNRIIDAIKTRKLEPCDTNVLILGFTYKKDSSDIRNTKVAEIIKRIRGKVKRIDCYDPLVDIQSAKDNYDLDVITDFSEITDHYDMVIKLVNHSCFESFVMDNIVELSSLL